MTLIYSLVLGSDMQTVYARAFAISLNVFTMLATVIHPLILAFVAVPVWSRSGDRVAFEAFYRAVIC